MVPPIAHIANKKRSGIREICFIAENLSYPIRIKVIIFIPVKYVNPPPINNERGSSSIMYINVKVITLLLPYFFSRRNANDIICTL